jgi:FkbM family methyltransferase
VTARHGGELIVNVRGGARVCVPRDLGQYTPYILLEQEDWFEDEIRFVRRWLGEGMRAVDVGASYGLYTLAMARAVGAGGRVWAFEPTPAVADHLERSVRLNALGNVSVRRAAVSDRQGWLDFHIGEQAELNAVASPGSVATATRVAAVTLDQIADEDKWGAIDFLKLDVEGHEREAIDGARRLLASASPLVMLEIKSESGTNMGALGLLKELGYASYYLLPGPLVLAPMDAPEPVSDYQLNAFACKADRAAALAQGGFLVRDPSRRLDAPRREAWTQFARSVPYARDIWRSWSPKGGSWLSPHRNTYADGLAAYALSRDASLGAEERVAWLFGSLHRLAEAMQMSDTPARRFSYARVARDLAQREEAMEALRGIVMQIKRGVRLDSREPFIAPSQHCEGRPVRIRDAKWLHCTVLEEMERLRAFSSCFDPENSLLHLQQIVPLPGHSAEMDRRLQLIRMRQGLQDGPEPVAALLERSEDNLNPEFWAQVARDA